MMAPMTHQGIELRSTASTSRSIQLFFTTAERTRAGYQPPG
jgi:hypothetical protein